MNALIAVCQFGSYDPGNRRLTRFSDPKDRGLDGWVTHDPLPTSQPVEGLRVLRDLAAQLDPCDN